MNPILKILFSIFFLFFCIHCNSSANSIATNSNNNQNAQIATPSEGTINLPKSMSFNSLPHAGSVDQTFSYYEITGLTVGQHYLVNLNGLSDNADLSFYDADNTFTTSVCSSTNTSTSTEVCSIYVGGPTVYIKVTGSLTAAGANYSLTVKNNTISFTPKDTIPELTSTPYIIPDSITGSTGGTVSVMVPVDTETGLIDLSIKDSLGNIVGSGIISVTPIPATFPTINVPVNIPGGIFTAGSYVYIDVKLSTSSINYANLNYNRYGILTGLPAAGSMYEKQLYTGGKVTGAKVNTNVEATILAIK